MNCDITQNLSQQAVRMRAIVRRVIFVVSLLLIAPVSVWAQQSTTVRFKIASTGHQLVQAMVNGRGPFWMVFDTGACFTSVTPATGGSGVVTLDLGGAKATLPVSSHEHSVLRGLKQLHPDLAPVEGMLGHDFFARFRVTIDYEKREMTFTPNGYNPGNTYQKLVARRSGARTQKSTPPRAVLLGVTVQDPVGNAHGAYVASVLPGSAAEAAGIRKGDYIIGVNEWWVEDTQDLHASIATLAPGAPARFWVTREGRAVQLHLNTRPGL